MFMGLIEAKINELLMQSGQSFAQQSNEDKFDINSKFCSGVLLNPKPGSNSS